MPVHDIVGKESLDSLIGSSKLLFVDFRAEWCGPCRMLGPVLHDLAAKYDAVDVAKINVDEENNQTLSMEFGVRSIPQVTIFKDGEKVDQFIGALPPEEVEAYIKKYLGE